jgi:hypothetical protein
MASARSHIASREPIAPSRGDMPHPLAPLGAFLAPGPIIAVTPNQEPPHGCTGGLAAGFESGVFDAVFMSKMNVRSE